MTKKEKKILFKILLKTILGIIAIQIIMLIALIKSGIYVL